MEMVIFQKIIGTYYYANGDKYEGDWENDMRIGDGNFNDIL